MRKMILADGGDDLPADEHLPSAEKVKKRAELATAARKAALGELEPFQKADFVGLFEAMDGLPVTIRLLDPPLHEFLPHDDAGPGRGRQAASAWTRREGQEAGRAAPRVRTRCSGFRGCRLAIKFPEIADMQVRAIIEAAMRGQEEGHESVLPEIMIPLVGTVEELVVPQEAGHRRRRRVP